MIGIVTNDHMPRVRGTTMSEHLGALDPEPAWPDWPLSREAVAELARYVDPGRAEDFVPSDAVGPWAQDPKQGVLRVVRLYESLRARHIPYAIEPWNRSEEHTSELQSLRHLV